MSAIFANRVRSAAADAVRGLAVGLAAIAALVSVQAFAQSANSIDQVTVSKGTSGRTIVKFTLRNPPANAPAGFAIANPRGSRSTSSRRRTAWGPRSGRSTTPRSAA